MVVSPSWQIAHIPACCRTLRFSSFRISPVIAVPDVLASGADHRLAELPVLGAGPWEGSPGRSSKAIYELGRIRWNGVSWRVSRLREGVHEWFQRRNGY
jgi:hypothetical protein